MNHLSMIIVFSLEKEMVFITEGMYTKYIMGE
jgi:hypothetical protein